MCRGKSRSLRQNDNTRQNMNLSSAKRRASSGGVHNRPAGGPLWKLDKDLKLRADLTQNDTISPCRVLDQVASMGFQLFACPECEYQNVYVFVRRDGGL